MKILLHSMMDLGRKKQMVKLLNEYCYQKPCTVKNNKEACKDCCKFHNGKFCPLLDIKEQVTYELWKVNHEH